MDDLYTKKHMMEALKAAGEKYPKLKIGHSYITLLKMERTGVINLANRSLTVNDRNWRFYTGKEIKENVDRVVAHKKEQILKRKVKPDGV